MLLLDEVTRILGHQYYATTRLHYLHGMEWVAPAFLPQIRPYTHAQLRYIWGIKPSSNDIARILTMLSPEYAKLSPSDKKQYTPYIDNLTLIKKLCPRLGLATASNTHCKSHNFDATSHPDWLPLWTQAIVEISHTHPYRFEWETRDMLKGLSKFPERFTKLSEAWRVFGQYQGIEWHKTQRTALRALGKMYIEDNDTLKKNHKPYLQVYFLASCNQKVTKAIEILKQSRLNYRCQITLYQNRKRLDSNKWESIQKVLRTRKDNAQKIVIATGSTYLKISVMIGISDAVLLTHFQAWWNTMICDTNG
ncbi:MAG: hypothetical protein ACPHV3_07340 [Vibrio sp.]